jgi:chromosome partitioning protein
VLASFLSSSIKIKESHQQARPMIHLDRSHKVTLEFGALFDELDAAGKARIKAATKKRA